jgi:mannose-6-phosphate isomerase-like protein (cupin superfamily)
MIEGKIWGTTELLLKTPLIEIRRFKVRPSAHCSWHKHALKWNLFICLDGELIVERKRKDYPLIDRTVLDPGQVCAVPPGEFHRFKTGTWKAEAVEIYYPAEVQEDDIEREDCGGLDSA